MFKETLLVEPKLDPGATSRMVRTLAQRFGDVAKKFGSGLLTALTGGGLAGLGLGLIDKLINPLKETQDAIDRVLKQGDDIVTNAKQFGTTAGKLFRLQALAKSTGLDESSLNILLTKFQTAVAEASADPSKVTSVRNFVGQKDSAEAFFEFIQALQKMSKTQQILVQQEVFGEKQILKMADFLNTDFAKQASLVGGPSSEKLTPGLEKLGALNDLKDALSARRDLDDVLKKASIITTQMINSQNEQLKLDLKKENKQIQSYEDLAAISISSAQLLEVVKTGILNLTSAFVKSSNLADNVKKLTQTRIMRGALRPPGLPDGIGD